MRARRIVELVALTVAVISTSGTRDLVPSPSPVRAVTLVVAAPVPVVVVERSTIVRVTAGGAPIANADVAINDGRAVTSVRTDREGVAHVAELAGPHELWATAPGLASAVARVAGVESIELAMVPAADVHGHVEGAGVVTLVPLDLDQTVRTIAVHGDFDIVGVPFGRWRVEADVAGFVQPGEQIVNVTKNATIDVPLVRSGSVTGMVVDGTGAPVANATIVLGAQSGTAPPHQLELAETALRWVHPLAGARWLPVIDDARFGADRMGSRLVECGRGHCGIDIGRDRGSLVHAAADGEIAALFPDGRTEAGRVVVIHHGHGLKSFYMHLDHLQPGLEVGQKVHAGDPVGTLGSTGFDRPLPHLHFAITYEAGGRTWYLDPEPIIRRAVVLAPDEIWSPREVGVAAPALARITTDAHGAFLIDDVGPGTYAAGVFAEGLAPGSSGAFVVKSGEAASTMITLSTGVTVEGRVVGRDGPIEGATIIASAGFGETAHKVAMTTTDRYGEYALHTLGGKLTLSATAPSCGESARDFVIDTHRDDGRRRENFTLTVEDAQLRGQVVMPDGAAAANITLHTVEGPTRRYGHTDAQGRFTLDHVAHGHYVVELEASDAPTKRVSLDSDRWTEIRLDAGGGVRILVRDAHSNAVLAGVHVDIGGLHVVTDARGMVELRRLAPGDATIAAHLAGYAATSRSLAITASRTGDVTLELSRGATIEGVVRDRFGHRVANARVSIGGASSIADRDGTFKLEDIAPGSVTLEADADTRHGLLAVQLAPGDSRLVTVDLAD